MEKELSFVLNIYAMNALISPKTCQFCQEPLQGRSDKKYCDDGCRSAYHNQSPSQRRQLTRQIHHQLQHNYQILRQLAPHKPMDRDGLSKLGFDFGCITGISHRKQRIQHYWVYDLGFRVKRNGVVEVIRAY